MEKNEVKTRIENNENRFKNGNDLEDTSEKMARRYYQTRSAAEENRRKGERIYYKPERGYYIVRPKKRNWWDIF